MVNEAVTGIFDESMSRSAFDEPRQGQGLEPGFPKWLARVANDGSTKGVPARVHPKPAW